MPCILVNKKRNTLVETGGVGGELNRTINITSAKRYTGYARLCEKKWCAVYRDVLLRGVSPSLRSPAPSAPTQNVSKVNKDKSLGNYMSTYERCADIRDILHLGVSS